MCLLPLAGSGEGIGFAGTISQASANRCSSLRRVRRVAQSRRDEFQDHLIGTGRKGVGVNEASTGIWMALPDQSEVLEYFDRYSNWNRWGSDDELGTLNFVTAEKRVEASRLVRSGAVASCARIVDTLSEPNNEMGPPQRFVKIGRA